MENIIRVLAILCILFGVGAIVASAQINPGAKVSVPFSFNVGNRTHDSGEYSFRFVRSGLGAARLVIQRQGTDEVQTVLLRDFSGDTDEGFRLVFGGEEGSKFLAGITTASGSYLLVEAPEPSAATLTSITRPAGKSKM